MKLVAETRPEERGNSSSQGRCGCCQYRQVWWKRARGDVSRVDDVVISWISLVIYLFYTTFIFYKTSRRFYYLRELLGIGLCISRGTATVLNICCALVLLPLCKKLNQLLYRILSKLCPGLFFFWLEKAKSFHMTVAITLVIFAGGNYDETLKEINLANYKNENPLMLLMSPAGLTGVTMLVITLTMALTSMRIVRQKVYNAFWYTHQLYMPFMVLLIVHPLSGVLKEEIFVEKRLNYIDKEENNDISRIHSPVFVPIQSKATHMARRTISLTLSCHEQFSCRAGQYVLLQCQEVSRLEWHPFTVVKVPTSSQRNFIVWIRVKGDWTDALERLLLQKGSDNLNILVDGPFSSPMEGVRRSRVAVCVAAGVGITPFVATLHDMLLNPRKLLPGRVHLLWIVRHERELTWLAELATEVLSELRSANRPDRLQLELYITNSDMDEENKKQNTSHVVEINERGSITHVVTNGINDEKVTLLTPNRKRRDYLNIAKCESVRADYNLAKEFPLLACRAKPGRPHWDRLFGYWVHLYPEDHLNVYCCGPKTLVKMLRCKCKITGIGTYRSRNDIMALLGSVDKSLAGYNFTAKVIVFLYKRKQLEILITEINHSGDQILMITFTVPCVSRGIAMQGIVCGLVMYVCDQLVDVQERIRALVYTPESERVMREKFKDIIKKHIRLIKYSQTMSEIFKEYFLIQNLAVTVELCLSAFMATITGLEQQSLLASFVAFLCVALLNAFIYCYLGDELIVQSQSIALAAYESTWTSWPPDLQKDLQILIRAAQKPLKLSAGGVADMSMQTYSQTLYNGYSIFAVLNDADILECKDSMEALSELNEKGREKISQLREELESMEVYGKETCDDKYSIEMEAQKHQLVLLLKEFKEANISSMFAIEKAQREELLKPPEGDDSSLRNRKKKVDRDALLEKSSGVTEQLLAISRQLADTTQRSQNTLDSLVSSSSAVHGTQSELLNTAGSISQSSKLLKKYGRREFTDKLIMFFAFLFFLAVCLYIVQRRLF
ncbi:hypothetical protein MSG28_003592 [Choristoneura fumiferana]|uniref:Uncharacterized protein n=1 Tax=Choristoneura fumiferana TaxID=7141 RepID=A0ACC0KGA0_CHOFU|nr:hypothetical protein MSG28_003592 [Choristoneura fumiferana]